MIKSATLVFLFAVGIFSCKQGGNVEYVKKSSTQNAEHPTENCPPGTMPSNANKLHGDDDKNCVPMTTTPAPTYQQGPMQTFKPTATPHSDNDGHHHG